MEPDLCVLNSVVCSEKDLQRFPIKLWRIIDCCTTGAIAWGNDGKNVVINRAKFEMQYMRAEHGLFKTESFTSLIRQMNMYGFKKVAKTYSEDRNLSEYHNPYFTKHFKDFSKIQRSGKRYREPRNTDDALERILQIDRDGNDSYSFLKHTTSAPPLCELLDNQESGVNDQTQCLDWHMICDDGIENQAVSASSNVESSDSRQKNDQMSSLQYQEILQQLGNNSIFQTQSQQAISNFEDVDDVCLDDPQLDITSFLCQDLTIGDLFSQQELALIESMGQSGIEQSDIDLDVFEDNTLDQSAETAGDNFQNIEHVTNRITTSYHCEQAVQHSPKRRKSRNVNARQKPYKNSVSSNPEKVSKTCDDVYERMVDDKGEVYVVVPISLPNTESTRPISLKISQ